MGKQFQKARNIRVDRHLVILLRIVQPRQISDGPAPPGSLFQFDLEVNRHRCHQIRMQRRRGRQRIMERTTGQTPLISLVIIELELHQSAD